MKHLMFLRYVVTLFLINLLFALVWTFLNNMFILQSELLC